MARIKIALATCNWPMPRAIEFMIVSTKVKAGLSDYYVGVPSKELMALFDGFEPVGEGELPKVVDSLVLADMDAFKERFKFRHELRRS
jgi:hypothetical protein